MNFAQKLDMLHEFAVACKHEPHKLYLIQRLAEHAEDSEMTAGFLEWMEKKIVAS